MQHAVILCCILWLCDRFHVFWMLGCRESDLLLELAMAKRSQRSHFRRAKDRLVRVWGLMSILDYCHFRSPRKMLIYKRQRCREGK